MLRFSSFVRAGVLLGGALAIFSIGCGDSEGTGGSGASGGGPTTGGAGTGGDGTGGEGTGGTASFPCSPSESCEAGHACLSLADNSSATVLGFRMSQLSIEQPASLATGLVGGILSDAALPSLPSCNVNGVGTFNWLLEFDDAAGTLTTGGAKPVADPTAGYTFVDEMVAGLAVAPAQTDAALGADGSFATTIGVDVLLPVYLDASATQAVVLPLSNAQLTGTASADRNCIGHYNAEGLEPAAECVGDAENPTFVNGGTASGYITLEDADQVVIDSLQQTLCVLLSGNPAMYGTNGTPKACTRDGNGVILFQGDWCSSTDSAGGCQDAVRFGAAFAASAVTIQ